MTTMALVVCAGSTRALVKFDFEQKFFLEWGLEVKDHSIVRVDGVYHLFYLRGNPAVNVGHATSPDLIHWQREEPLLSITPGSFDNRALWAPQVIFARNAWWMFYTGVNIQWSQRTGFALSGDLFNWYKYPLEIYHPDPTWAEWWEDAWCHGRDPFVFEHEGLYYLLNTAKTWWNRGAISCATSNDLVDWTDIDPIYINPTWHVMESVQLIKRSGKFHMFFTEETIPGTSYMSSDSLFSWDGANKTVIDLGHAPEIHEFDQGINMFSRHTTHPWGNDTYQWVIRLDTLVWVGETNPVVQFSWPLEQNWDLVSGDAFQNQPTFLNNLAWRGDSVDVGFKGLSWLSSYENYQGPLGAGAAGAYLGDGAMGTIRSRTFELTGRSMELLVGGTNDESNCYVALVDANTQQIILGETGKDTDEMDRRLWDLKSYKGRQVYIEVADNSATGHISCDEIEEFPYAVGKGTTKDDPFRATEVTNSLTAASLSQNNPNPFNPTTTISYYLPNAALVALDIFDVRGRRIRQLVYRTEEPGHHEIVWNGHDDGGTLLTTGLYFYRLTVDGATVDTKKMILLK